MKRWIVILLVVLAVLVLISPGIIGRLTERNLEDNIARAKLDSPTVTISTERFQRGWFTSAGRHRIELSDRGAFPLLAGFVDEAGYDEMPALIVDSRIDHGLLPISSMSGEDGSMAPAIARLVSTLQLDPGNGELVELPGHIYSAIGLMGETEARLLIGEGRFEGGDAAIGWQGAELQMTLGSQGAIAAVAGFVGPVSLSSAGGSMESGRIDVSAKSRQGGYGLTVGSVLLKSDAVTSSGPHGSGLGYSSLQLGAETDVVDDEVIGSGTFDISGISVPALGVVDIGLDMSYDGFDAESFSQLLAAFKQAATDGGPEDAFAALYPSMNTELQQFLSAGAELRFDRLNITLPQGRVATNFVFSLPETRAGDAFSWPGLLLKLRASINLSLPADVFEVLLALQPEARAAVATGFLVLDGDEYKMKLEYSQGLATVNGLPMAVPMPGPR